MWAVLDSWIAMKDSETRQHEQFSEEMNNIYRLTSILISTLLVYCTLLVYLSNKAVETESPVRRFTAPPCFSGRVLYVSSDTFHFLFLPCGTTIIENT